MQHKAAPLGRLRIDIGKIFEIGRLRQFAKGGKAVGFALGGAGKGGQSQSRQACGQKFQHGPTIESEHSAPRLK